MSRNTLQSGGLAGGFANQQTATEVPQKESGLVNAINGLDCAVNQLSAAMKQLDQRTSSVRVHEKPSDSICPGEPTPTDCDAAQKIREITFRLRCATSHARQLEREMDC